MPGCRRGADPVETSLCRGAGAVSGLGASELRPPARVSGAARTVVGEARAGIEITPVPALTAAARAQNGRVRATLLECLKLHVELQIEARVTVVCGWHADAFTK